MHLSVNDIIKATNGELICGNSDIIIKNIKTDSRQADKDSLFIPIKGERFDAHDFFDSAIDNGCRVFLTERKLNFRDNITYIKVNDTKKALGDLARHYLNIKNPIRIAVTGSVGKTTTKDMIYSVVTKFGKALKTKGNFNNDIGLPLTVFEIEDEKIVVLEMGMNHFNEISYLSSIVRPNIVVITNIGYSHIENLGSKEGILKAKLEVLDYMDKDGVLILNGDDKYLRTVKGNIENEVCCFGMENEECDIIASSIKQREDGSTFFVEDEEYVLNVPGKHNIYNALSAIAIGKLLNIAYEDLKDAILNFKMTGMRLNIKKHNGYTVIEDCYNAAPDSIIASLNVLSEIKSNRKIAVLGSVAELGDRRDRLLYEIGAKVKDFNVDLLITVTEDAKAINLGARDSGFKNEVNFDNNDGAKKYLKDILKNNDAVLIKGSRKYKLEEISEYIVKEGI